MIRVAAFIAAVVVATVVLTFIVTRPTGRVIWQSCQPADIRYGSFDPYCLSVVEGAPDLDYLFFWDRRRYSLWIARGPDAPSYGHAVAFSFTPGFEDPDDHIRGSTAEWTKDGVTFVAKSGHRVYFPKDTFIGGR